MERFLQQLNTIPEVAELVRRVEEGGCPAAVTGLQPVQRACVGAAVARGAGRPAVFVCGDEREVRQLTGDLRTLTGTDPVVLLARERSYRKDAERRVASARMYDGHQKVRVSKNAEGVTLELPAVPKGVDTIVELTLK